MKICSISTNFGKNPEWYTHYDAKEFAEVRNVQEALLLPEGKPGEADGEVKIENREGTETSLTGTID
jgi:hypothetical protein